MLLINPQPLKGHFEMKIPMFPGDNVKKFIARIVKQDRAVKSQYTILSRLLRTITYKILTCAYNKVDLFLLRNTLSHNSEKS